MEQERTLNPDSASGDAASEDDADGADEGPVDPDAQDSAF